MERRKKPSKFAPRKKESTSQKKEVSLSKKASSRKKEDSSKLEDDSKPNNELIRLNRYIANAGVCSRRDADKLIEAGEITVNDKVVTEMGHKVSSSDTVKHGRKILNREKTTYVLLNKPKDFITTMDDPQGRRTVMELVKKAGDERIYPVGRLDRNTTGLLLLTNDGELAKKLSHPSSNIKKLYQVEIDKPITENHFHDIMEGLELEDGVIHVDDLAIVGGNKSVLGIDIHVGRNRIVRRIFEHLGYEVTKLDRVMYAGLTKKDLGRGKWRHLTEKEVIRLKHKK
ncbi:MAG: rRNA pseudouridine synthase [Cyclobacteriaceae bacterium]|nr:rRNA pseudouridine synthase [Cyclobacteriaceae bacterium]